MQIEFWAAQAGIESPGALLRKGWTWDDVMRRLRVTYDKHLAEIRAMRRAERNP